MKRLINISKKIKAFFICIVRHSFLLKKANDRLNDVDFYDLMQQYRMADMADQETVVRRFETIKEWIRQNYA